MTENHGQAPIPVPPWWVRILIALGFLGLLVVDPLNAGSASGQRSEQALLRIASPFYRASGDVTVILIDDDYLQQRGSGWPMSYREQGLLLRRILAYEPSAVFVDLLYRHRHGRTDASTSDDEPLDLLRPLASAADKPVPVLFAALSVDPAAGKAADYCSRSTPVNAAAAGNLVDPASIEPTLRPLLGLGTAGPEAAATPAEPAAARPRFGVAAVGWSGCGGSYPLLLAGNTRATTPAMAMFEQSCAAGMKARGCRSLAAATPSLAAFSSPMIVRWGAFAPATQSRFYAANVCQRYEDLAHPVSHANRLAMALRQFALGAIVDLRNTGDPALALPCPAIPVLRADAVIDGDEALMRTLLHGKAVFVGARVSGIPDWIPSPVHGQVPGVVLHAMALDNLFAHGDSYTKPMPSTVSRWIMVLLASTVALLAPLLVARKPWFSEFVRAGVGLALWAGYALVLALHGHFLKAVVVLGVAALFDLMKPLETFRYLWLILAMALLAFIALASGWSPWNWIGLAFVVVATLEAFKASLKHSPPKPFPHPASLLRRLATTLRSRYA